MVQQCSVGFQLLRPTPTIYHSNARYGYKNAEGLGRHRSRLFCMAEWRTRSSVKHGALLWRRLAALYRRCNRCDVLLE